MSTACRTPLGGEGGPQSPKLLPCRRRVLDQPIPALGGKAPRAAAKTPKGREKVAAWLKALENHSAKRPAGDPIGGYDFGWMWQELGVEALRQ